jgi:hypothetical protein
MCNIGFTPQIVEMFDYNCCLAADGFIFLLQMGLDAFWGRSTGNKIFNWQQNIQLATKYSTSDKTFNVETFD